MCVILWIVATAIICVLTFDYNDSGTDSSSDSNIIWSPDPLGIKSGWSRVYPALKYGSGFPDDLDSGTDDQDLYGLVVVVENSSFAPIEEIVTDVFDRDPQLVFNAKGGMMYARSGDDIGLVFSNNVIHGSFYLLLRRIIIDDHPVQTKSVREMNWVDQEWKRSRIYPITQNKIVLQNWS